MKATHKGWLIFCPVYVDTTASAPVVWPRWDCMTWLLYAAIWCQQSAIEYLSATREGYVPAYVIKLTGVKTQ